MGCIQLPGQQLLERCYMGCQGWECHARCTEFLGQQGLGVL